MSLRTKRKQLEKLRRVGLSNRQIGKQYGVSGEWIAQILGRTGHKHRAHEEATILAARKLWDQGWSTSEIGCALTTRKREFTKNAVVGLAHRNNFPPRPSPIKRTA